MPKLTRAALPAILVLSTTACDPQEPLSSEAVQVDAVANITTSWPSAGDPGAPFYARIEPEPPHIYSDGTWAFVLFYRDPACVPAGFNLLQFFGPPAAFGCTAVVNGTSVWIGAPGVGAPRVTRVSGSAVPVWFFPADVLLDAIADGMLTMGELQAVPGRVVGTAAHVSETNHPHSLPPQLGGGGHPNPKLVLQARGALEDGRSFSIHLVRNDRDIPSIAIAIR